ncbi:MAG: hypothetical protein KF754_04810 [Planctomycetes bacterium]|nr:hypothetical protein [Planctomycetota bacterium]
MQRIDNPAPGAGPVASSPAPRPAAKPEDLPSFELPSTAALERAAADKKPIVVYFPGEKDDGSALAHPDIAFLSKNSALFIKVPFNANREKDPWDVGSVVPTSKLLSDNPSREYGVKVGRETVIVTDSWGNDFFRFEKAPSAEELRSSIKKVSDKVDSANKKLQKTYDAAKAAWDKNDRSNALKSVLKNFKEGLVGLEAQQNSISLYHEIMDAARASISDMAGKGDKEALKGIAKELKGTDAAKDAEAALAKLK